MKFRTQREGQKFHIVALELDNGDCPAVEYLRSLKTLNPAAHKKMHSILKRHADAGPILNERISRPLEGHRYQGLLEFKTTQGARLFYFYIEGGVTVLTNGCDKTDPAKPSYELARSLKLELEEVLSHGNRGQLHRSD